MTVPILACCSFAQWSGGRTLGIGRPFRPSSAVFSRSAARIGLLPDGLAVAPRPRAPLTGVARERGFVVAPEAPPLGGRAPAGAG